MNIQGFQKLTMLDFPGHTACTIFTGGCNLRCPFCHNVPLVLDPKGNAPFSEEEVLAYLEKRRGLIEGIAITGGEPLLQSDIADFCREVKSRGFLVKLDSNGSFPDKLEQLINEGLVDFVAMDIKNSKEKYAATCGISNLSIAPFEKSVEILKKGKIPFEFRTTVIKEYHSLEDIEKIGQWIESATDYALQMFKDSGILCEGSCSPLSEEDIYKMKNIGEKYVQNVHIRGI